MRLLEYIKARFALDTEFVIAFWWLYMILALSMVVCVIIYIKKR